MKRKIISILLISAMIATACFSTGCSKKGEDPASTEEIDLSKQADYDTPDDFTPFSYATEEELPEDNFYIVHTEKVKEKGKTKEITSYYPIYNAEHTYDGMNDSPAGEDPTRIMWVNYNIDEGLIPTFYPGDKLIYKSSTSIPTTYSLEKFYDDGYTIGVSGLKQDLSNNYQYSVDTGGFVMSTSDAAGFDGLKADSIYLVSVGEDRVTPQNVSTSGTVTGLELMHAYACDIRTGTEKVAATMTANIHVFSSAENYLFGAFTFITDHIAEIEIPDYVTTGYYNMNGLGMFRFLKTEESYKDLDEVDYNDVIYTYDENYHTPTGTHIGLIFDENGFLVKDTEYSDDDYDSDAYTDEESTLDIDTTDADKVDENGFSSGTYKLTKVSEPTVYASGKYYTVRGTDSSKKKTFSGRLYIENNSSIAAPVEGKNYVLSYTKSTRSDYKGDEIFTIDETE